MGGESVTESSVSGASGSVCGSVGSPVRGGVVVQDVGRAGGCTVGLLGRAFPQEVWWRGEPCFRPESGRVLLARTLGMDALEARYRGRVLLATAVGDRRGALTPAALLAAIEQECGVWPSEVCIEVASPPHDLWLTFSTSALCTRVLDASMQMRCASSWVKFGRWNRGIHATPGALEYKVKLSFEGLPDEAWELDAVNGVLKELDGELIDILPPADRCELEVNAWLRDPCIVPKVVTVEVSEPKVLMWSSLPLSDDDVDSPLAPTSPTKRRTLLHQVIVHVKEVLDRGPLLVEDLPEEWLRDEGADLSRTHMFDTWRGKVNGTGPGGASSGGGGDGAVV